MKFSKILKNAISVFVVLSLSLTFVEYKSSAETLDLSQPQSLKVNLLSDALGVPTTDLVFSWILNSTFSSDMQQSYEIQISDSITDLKNDKADVKDTGKVNSSDSVNVKIEGLSLNENSLYYWRVRVWDTKGNVSPYSEPAFMTTEVGTKWASTKAIWSRITDSSQKGNFAFLRTNFQIDNVDNINKAIISVTAASSRESKEYVYDLSLNGNSVGVGPTRGYNDNLLYNTYDVTQFLKSGKNSIGAINYALDTKMFLLQMTVFYKDGTSKILLNSGRDSDNWRSMDGTEIFGDNGKSVGTYYYTQAAENINANLYPQGFDKPDFDSSKWDFCENAGTFTQEKLVATTVSSEKKFDESPVSVTTLEKGHYIIDFGKELIGQFSLSVESEQNADITVRYGEEKSGNTVKYNTRSSNDYEEHWTLKKGSQTLTTFGMKNYRYVEIINSPVKITSKNIKGFSLRQDFNYNDSYFDSSNQTLNDIYKMSKYTAETTNQDVHVDSQLRERTPYSGDELIEMLLNFNTNSDATLSQYTTEYLCNTDSAYTDYKLINIILCWKNYLYTGNKDILEKCYGNLRSNSLMDNSIDKKYNLIAKTNGNLVDWPTSERDGYVMSAKYNTVINAIAYEAYSDFSKIAAALNKKYDEIKYAETAQNIKTSMMKYLYNEDYGAFSDGLDENGKMIDHYSQHASAFSLAFNIVDDDAIQKRVSAYVSKEGVLKTSVYGASFVLSGLYNADSGDDAMEILTSTGTRSWYHMIKDLDSTISAENWDPSLKSNMTFSHPWGSAAANRIVDGIFGIEPTEAGFSSFDVKFQPGDLKNASITVPTVKGSIEASFTNIDGFSTSLTIPFNTKAKVYIPESTKKISQLSVDGNAVAAQRDGDYLVVELGSGRHSISYQKPDETVQEVSVSYQGQVQKIGWQSSVSNGAVCGTSGSSLRLETVKINCVDAPKDLHVSYRVHVEKLGWQDWVSDGQIAGTVGKGLRLEAIQVKLTGADAKNYTVEYQTHVQKVGWQDWVSDGKISGTTGKALRVEALKIKIVPKSNIPTVTYQSQIQKIGWQNFVEQNETSGTTGRSLRVEAIKVNLNNAPSGLHIEYRVHVQKIGWTSWLPEGALSGTVGKALRVEGIEIRLRGVDAEKYSVEYQSHVQKLGWQNWVKDGALSGTTGKSLRVEALKIKIVQKG